MPGWTSSLDKIAEDIAIEIRSGRWDHVEEIHRKPVPACALIVDELRRRCPGKTTDQYQRALAEALQATR